MPFYFIHWTQDTIDHVEEVEEHGVTPREFEEVVMNPEKTRVSRSSDRDLAFGWTSSGKYLCCAYDLDDDGIVVYPVTAYEVEP